MQSILPLILATGIVAQEFFSSQIALERLSKEEDRMMQEFENELGENFTYLEMKLK